MTTTTDEATIQVTADELIALVRDRGCRPFWYSTGRVCVNTRSLGLVLGLRALGASAIRYQPEAHTNPLVTAWEVRLDRIPCEGDIYAAAREAAEGGLLDE
jgi:hypothetical protein